MHLSAFQLSFAGQSYTLATADVFTTPAAVFASGSLIGIDYQDADAANPGLRPWVQLVAGFTELSEAQFAYDTKGNGVEGFGSYAVTAVPEPGTVALMLAGLGLLGGRAQPARLVPDQATRGFIRARCPPSWPA